MVNLLARLGIFPLLLMSLHVSADTDYHWSLGPSLPESVQEIYPAIFKDAIYVVGGLTDEEETFAVSDQVYRLTKGAKQWETLPPFPSPMHHVMLVATEKDLWSFGGFTETAQGKWTNSDAVYQFDEKTEQWQSRNPMPVKLSESIGAVINGSVHLAGGRTTANKNHEWQDHLDSNWHGVFDADVGVWKTAAPLPTPRNSACSVVVNEKWHVIGGRTVKGGNTDVHEVFDPIKDSWETAKAMPEPEAGIGCSLYQGDIYVFGGEFLGQPTGVFHKVWRYEVDRKRWSQVSVMPVPRHGLGVVTFDDAIWLIGGAAEAGAHDTRHTVSKMKKVAR